MNLIIPPAQWNNEFYIQMWRSLKILSTCVLPALLFISACNAYPVITTMADSSAEFSHYRTFAWLPDKGDTNYRPFNNEIIRNNIRNYFAQNFSARGYSVNLESPDLLLEINIKNKPVASRIVCTPYPPDYYYHRYFYGSIYYYPYPWNFYYRYYYPFPPVVCGPEPAYIDGGITLNVYDRLTGRLVWSGSASGDIYDPGYISRSIHPAVEAIMKKYPVKVVSPRVVKPDKTERLL
jgi:hypothetical protein